MEFEKYTERARGFIQSAQSLALRDGQLLVLGVSYEGGPMDTKTVQVKEGFLKSDLRLAGLEVDPYNGILVAYGTGQQTGGVFLQINPAWGAATELLLGEGQLPLWARIGRLALHRDGHFVLGSWQAL